MARIQNKITEYDRAVRALDLSSQDEDFNILSDYINNTGSELLREKRKNLVRKLKYYRNFENMERYHRKFLKIQTKQEGIINFTWKPAQAKLYYHHILPKLYAKEPVRIYLLKARQIGFSTLIEGLGASFCSLFSDIHGGVVAHDVETASKIHKMCKLFYKSLPNDFRPARKKSNRKELELSNPKEDGELGLESSFTVGTARNPHLGAGQTLRFIHLSEFARYEQVNDTIEDSLTALYQTIPLSYGTFIFIETTAFGEGLGKRYWDDSSNGFDKVFISWVAEEGYRLNVPVNDRELQFDSKDKYGDELKAREQIIDELKFWYPTESLDTEWLQHESLCRLAWRRQYINEQVFGKVDLFQQEYPLTPEEAFRLSGRSVFNTYYLSELKKRAENIKPAIYTHIRPPADKLGYFQLEKLGPLKIYSLPEKDKFYFVGVDIGSGTKDGDYSVAQVFDHKYNQCAVYRDIIEPDLLAYPVVLLASLYNKAKIIPEANAMGVSTIARIINDLHYTNVYIRQKFNHLDNTFDNEWGFYTSRKTRPILINTLRNLISNSELKLYDLDTIVEFLNFVFLIKNNVVRMDAAPGMHDDTVMSTGLAVFDIDPEEELIKNIKGEVPYGSIEYFARQMDQDNESNFNNFGSVVGI